MCSGAVDSKPQTRVFVCTLGFADAELAAHSIAAMHASTTRARARRRSRVATTMVRAGTVFRV
jgi:hypothetical protein